MTATLLHALLAAMLAVGDGDQPQVIRLKVGTEVVGVILPESFDEAKGVRVRRVDDGALLDLSFDQMLPEDVRRIRADHGYMPDDPDPILVDAMKVTFLDGTSLVGVITEQGTETFKLRRGASVNELNRGRVRMIEPVKVDALEVYDAEELYGRELAAKSPVEALDHYNLALYCESLQLWGHAKEQLEEVQKVDPSFKDDVVAAKLKQYARRMEAGEDSETIAKAGRMVRHDDYNGALALLDKFLQDKPGSALRADAEKARARIAKARDAWLSEQVVIHFFTYLERGVRKVAGDPKGGPKEARKAVELDATKNAIEATAKWLHVTAGEVQKTWEDPKRQTASPHFGSYGSGTWTLGLEAALKGIVAEDPDKKPADGGAAAGKNETFEDKIKRLLEQKRKEQEAAQKRGKEAPKQQKPKGPQIYDVDPKEDEWWASLTTDEKTQYLLAWWAEHDPNAKVYRFDHLPCATCAGIGVIPYFDRSGQSSAIPCARCKGLGLDRIVRFH